MQDQTYRLDLIRRYHHMGLILSPVRPFYKRPCLWKGYTFFEGALNSQSVTFIRDARHNLDVESLTGWFRDHPMHNVSIILNQNQIVIDIDNPAVAEWDPILPQLEAYATMRCET